jgi:hypothetical protein
MPSGRVVKRLLLALLLAAGANSLAGTEPAWRFQLEPGKSVPSSVSVVNRCHAVHSYRISATATPGFVRFRGLVEVGRLPPGKTQKVDLDFISEGLQPGIYRGEVAVSCLDCAAEPRCSQSKDLFGIEMTVVPRQTSPAEELVDSTLELFWKLGAAEAEKPQQLASLAAAKPEEAAAQLRRLEIAPAGYDERIAGLAPVIPRFVFSDRFEDLVSRARSIGLNPDAAVSSPPPMIFRGKTLALLVIFEPRAAAAVWPAPVQPVAAVFVAGTNPLTLPARESGAELPYDAKPDLWKPGARIDHTFCADLTSAVQFVAKLTYRGGGTDTAHQDLPDPLPPNYGKCVKLSQQPRLQPAPPVIIASGFLITRRLQRTTLYAVPIVIPSKNP